MSLPDFWNHQQYHHHPTESASSRRPSSCQMAAASRARLTDERKSWWRFVDGWMLLIIEKDWRMAEKKTYSKNTYLFEGVQWCSQTLSSQNESFICNLKRIHGSLVVRRLALSCSMPISWYETPLSNHRFLIWTTKQATRPVPTMEFWNHPAKQTCHHLPGF